MLQTVAHVTQKLRVQACDSLKQFVTPSNGLQWPVLL
jgi:hypothetical protein